MEYTAKDHTFAVCAYKESQFLRECIESLVNQRVKSNIIITTSTDNEFIRSVADEYNIPLYINDGEGGIANDWNFAYHKADTEIVTLAHQDDTYEPGYVEDMLKRLNKKDKPLIYFTDYKELRNGQSVSGTMVKIKRIMLLPLIPPCFQSSRFMRRLSICFGNPIICPSVAYVKRNLPETVFVSKFRSNLDWEAWEKLTRHRGAFVYSPKTLTRHRVHQESETSNTINNGNIRAKEDYQMFLKFWPAWFAKFIMKFYIKAEKFNNV